MSTNAAMATAAGALADLGELREPKQPAPPCLSCSLHTVAMYVMAPGINCKAHRLCSRCWKDTSK